MNKAFLIILFLLTVRVYAAELNQRKIDSLQTVLKKDIPYWVRADAYYQIADEYWNTIDDKARQEANFTKSLEYAQNCIALSEKCGYKQGIADAYHVIAGVNDDRSNHIEALECEKKALNYRLEIGDEKKISQSLFSLGIIYNALGDNEQSLKYYFECLTLDERRGDSAEAAGLYHNIGMIYEAAGKRKDAISNIKKAMAINKVTGKKNWLATNYLMLGGLYFQDGRITEALTYYERARDVSLSLGQKELYGHALLGIGSVQSKFGRYPEAFNNFTAALSVFREIVNKNGVALTYNYLGSSYTQLKKFKEAAVCLDSCLRLCRELGAEAMRNVYQRLYELDSASGNLASAYKHYRLYITLRDSLKSNETVQAVAKQQLRFEYTKKEAVAQAEQEKKDALQLIIRNSVIAGLLGSVIFLFVVYRQRNRIKSVNTKNEELLLNILPAEVADELKEKGSAEAKHFDNVTVLFTDFKNFTTVSQELSPQQLVDELHECFKGFDEIISKYNIEKIKTIGDAYLAVCGLPVADEQHAENIVKAALDIRDFMRLRHESLGAKSFEIRIGINSGSVVAGIVGVKKFAYDIWGDTVNTAARMEQNSEAGKINISETTYELVKDNFSCEFRGEIDAKNKGKLKMYFVEKQ